MEVIRSRFHSKVDNSVARFTELRGEVALKDLEFLYRLRRYALVPLSIGRDQRNRHAIDENVSSPHLPAVHLKIVRRVASRVIAHIAHESWHQGDELSRVAKGAGDLQGEVVH